MIGKYRRNDPRLKDKGLFKVWSLTLEPYRPEDVMRAVVEHFRESKHFPDPTDIAQRCPMLRQIREDGRERTQTVWPNNGYDSPEAYVEQLRDMAEMGRLMAFDYSAAGLPHPAKARVLGWSMRVWNEKCREAMEKEGGGQDEKITAV